MQTAGVLNSQHREIAKSDGVQTGLLLWSFRRYVKSSLARQHHVQRYTEVLAMHASLKNSFRIGTPKFVCKAVGGEMQRGAAWETVACLRNELACRRHGPVLWNVLLDGDSTEVSLNIAKRGLVSYGVTTYRAIQIVFLQPFFATEVRSVDTVIYFSVAHRGASFTSRPRFRLCGPFVPSECRNSKICGYLHPTAHLKSRKST